MSTTSDSSKETSFSTSSIYETDLLLINVLLTQANQGKDKAQDVIRACKFVLNKLTKEEN